MRTPKKKLPPETEKERRRATIGRCITMLPYISRNNVREIMHITHATHLRPERFLHEKLHTKRDKSASLPHRQTPRRRQSLSHNAHLARLPHLHRVDDERALVEVLWPGRVPRILRPCKIEHRRYHTSINITLEINGQGERHAPFEPSSHGLLPTPSGNQPLVPPTARSRIK